MIRSFLITIGVLAVSLSIAKADPYETIPSFVLNADTVNALANLSDELKSTSQHADTHPQLMDLSPYLSPPQPQVIVLIQD